MGVLTVDLFPYGEALTLFSFEEEAQMFLHLRTEGGARCRVRQTSVGELISVLCGPRAQAKRMVLDPLPEPGGVALAGLLIMNRDRFLQALVGEASSYSYRAVPRNGASLRQATRVA